MTRPRNEDEDWIGIKKEEEEDEADEAAGRSEFVRPANCTCTVHERFPPSSSPSTPKQVSPNREIKQGQGLFLSRCNTAPV